MLPLQDLGRLNEPDTELQEMSKVEKDLLEELCELKAEFKELSLALEICDANLAEAQAIRLQLFEEKSARQKAKNKAKAARQKKKKRGSNKEPSTSSSSSGSLTASSSLTSTTSVSSNPTSITDIHDDRLEIPPLNEKIDHGNETILNNEFSYCDTQNITRRELLEDVRLDLQVNLDLSIDKLLRRLTLDQTIQEIRRSPSLSSEELLLLTEEALKLLITSTQISLMAHEENRVDTPPVTWLDGFGEVSSEEDGVELCKLLAFQGGRPAAWML
ncbi:hypothetical protein C8J56DRAFT_912351 [Mycena floridula]|nr:hypothetical protein C8J56DRAFT_912351 [Mycena floridula]